MLTRFAKVTYIKSFLPVSSQAFSSVDTIAPRPKERTIRDLRTTLYKPIEKLEFNKDERCLLYYYRPRFFSYALMYMKYLAPMGILGKLIAVNPFYMTFPVALPIMIFAELYLLKKVYDQKKLLRNVVGEIYLLKDGETLEVIYESKFWRKMKSDALSNYYYIPSLKAPENDEQNAPLKGDLFPEEFPFTDLKSAGWAWRKYFRNPRKYFIMPKNANYKNMEILVAAFSGKVIDTSKPNIVEIDHDVKEQYEMV